jgi:hypothetical protein
MAEKEGVTASVLRESSTRKDVLCPGVNALTATRSSREPSPQHQIQTEGREREGTTQPSDLAGGEVILPEFGWSSYSEVREREHWRVREMNERWGRGCGPTTKG